MSQLGEVLKVAVLQGRLKASQNGIKPQKAGREVIKDPDAELRKANDILNLLPNAIQDAAAEGKSSVKILDLKYDEHHFQDKVGANHYVTPDNCRFYVRRAIEEMQKAGLQVDICKTLGGEIWELHVNFSKLGA